MHCDWDPAKNLANIRLHGIDFADASGIFDGPTLERLDDRRGYGEERWIAVGLMREIEILVVYTERITQDRGTRWIISARRATRDERETFYRTLGR